MGFAVTRVKMDDRQLRLLRIEDPMKNCKPDKTIDQLFDEFLADQKARLSPRTLTKYEDVIDLYRSYLESYWPDHSHEEYNSDHQC